MTDCTTEACQHFQTKVKIKFGLRKQKDGLCNLLRNQRAQAWIPVHHLHRTGHSPSVPAKESPHALRQVTSAFGSTACPSRQTAHGTALNDKPARPRNDRRNRSRPTSFRSHEKEEGLPTENGRTMRTSMISCIPEGTRSMCSPLPTYRHADGNGTRYSSSSSSSRTESATFMPSIGKARSMTAL